MPTTFLQSASGDGWARVVGTIQATKQGDSVQIACEGMDFADVQVVLEDVSAWPTDLVLTLERSVDGGKFADMPSAMTFGAAGIYEVSSLKASSVVRVRNSTPSAVTALVRVAILVRRS